MPAATDELYHLAEIIGQTAGGLTLDDLAAKLHRPVPRRTLQRRLAALVQEHRITVVGKARATRYVAPRLPVRAQVQSSSRVMEEPEESRHIPTAAEEVRRLVTAPIFERRPVGYNRAFLDAYQPNVTFYLPPEIRASLREQSGALAAGLPAGTYLRQLMNRVLIDLSWNSSRLEGNTYSLLETERLLALGESADGKDIREAQMILNHKAAIELLADQPAEMGFNRYTLFSLHALLSYELLDDSAYSGRLRAHPVGISGTTFHPTGIPQVIEECFQQILATAEGISDPFEQAFFAMVHLPYLQPFADVNKRLSRLAANIPLVRHNLCPLSFVGVPAEDYVSGLLGVYELNRIELLRDVFVRAYERSCARYSAVRQQLGQPDPFSWRYRALLTEVVRAVILEPMDKKQAIEAIRRRAAEAVPEADRAPFVENAEIRLMSLHEGNFAPYRVRPSEFAAWQAVWR